MGSCGNLASADEPLSCGSAAAGELAPGQLTGEEAAQTSPDFGVNADQVSSRHEAEQSGIEEDCSPGDFDKSGSLVVATDGQCSENGGFQCENQSGADASSLDREASSGELGVGNLENGDGMPLELKSGIDCPDDPSEQIELGYRMRGNGPLVQEIESVEETADDLLVMEAGTEGCPSLLINGDECRSGREATMERKMISEEVAITPAGLLVNNQTGNCPLETCANLVDEKVDDVALENDTCNATPCPDTNGMPTENALSPGYPDGKSTKGEDKNESVLLIETVESIYAVGIDNLKLSPNGTKREADNLCPADSACRAVLETVQEDDRSVKCLSSEDASVEMMKEFSALAKVEAELCIGTPSSQVNEMPVEKTVDILLLDNDQMSNDNDTMTMSSLISETRGGARIGADSQYETSIALLHKMPCAQSSMRDCMIGSGQQTEKKSDGLLSGMPTELFSGSEDAKIDDMCCQNFPLGDDREKGLHVSSLLSNSAQVDGGEDSNGAAETNAEHIGEENALLVDKCIENGGESLHLKETAFNCESLSVGSLGLQSCKPHSTLKNCSLYSSNDSDVPCMAVTVATTSSAANDYISEKNEERKTHGRFDCLPEAESPLVITSSSRRSSRANKSGRKTQAKKASRYSRDASKVAYHHESLELIFKAAKKKRTCCSKTPRSSTWGIMQNISQHFEHINELGVESDQKQGSRKVRIGRGSGKQSTNQSGGTSQVSKGNVGGASNRIRLKLKMGKEVVMISEVVSTARGAFVSASSGGSISDVANLTDDVKEKNQLDCGGAKLENEKLYSGNHFVNGDSNLTVKESAQDGGGCFDPTLVQIESVCGTVEDTYLGSETSPDSEVINLTPEAQLSERPQEGAKDVALDSSKNLANFEDVLNSRKGKKKDKADLAFSNGHLEIENGANTFPGQDISSGLVDLEHLESNLLSAKQKEQKQVKSSKPSKVSSDRSKDLNSAKSRKGASCKQKKEKSTSKSKVKERGVRDELLCKAEDHALASDGVRDANQTCDAAAYMWTGDTSKSKIISNNLVEQELLLRNAWVRCDDCHKWRRIAAALADSIEDANSNWTCKDNQDKRFADCSILQEMSNADINAELELSDYSCEDDDYDGNRNYKELKPSHPTVPQQSSFIQIDSNKYLHRSRRTQTIDEIMVCHCKPPLDGKLGCGDECLNRMLNIECVQGTCPCGDHCSNQQFQKHKYANLQWFRCGKKGYGLQLLEDVSEGQFIIEYVGEVLDMPAYEERQRDYGAKGHKHFYFMTLNGSELILLLCFSQWMVNGEICIGLFAIRDIKKGEEVTFDYNYVRVFGAAAKKCVCGSPHCRGYIGGDLQSTETIVQGDSDDEFPEPVMLYEDGDVAYRFDNSIHRTVVGSDTRATDLVVKDRKEEVKEENTLGIKDPASQSVSIISQLDRSPDAEGTQENVSSSKPPHQELSLHPKDVRSTVSSEIQQKISIEDASNLNYTRSASDEKWSLAELRPLVKTPRAPSAIKKGKGSSNSQNVNKGQGTASKSQTVPIKPKKAIEGSSNGRFEAVQGKLNELLDADGGISKRKDAAKGYLKLLLLTAASGDSGNGEAIQSNRDLSMILDALLKTRSRVVLMDIINKNGLRMLHNIMKQYRRDFKKIPILRKLLKVLEYLAVREILTLEHINVGPPCPGMESFRESILSLTEHDDKQVHQIARNFRDRWIPRHLRKVGYAEKDDGMNSLRGLNFNFLSSHSNWRDTTLTRPVEASDGLHQPSLSAETSSATDNSSTDGGFTSGTWTRKRKTRWDSDTNPYLESLMRKEKDSLNRTEDGRENNHEEEGPPGFSSLDTSRVSSNGASTAVAVDQSGEKVQYMRCPFDAVIGQPQERFKSRSPVSYGVPLLILQQFGTPQAGSIENWAIAPGMPFQPFPPLPPFPRDRKRRSPPSSSDCGTNSSNSLYSSADEKKPVNLSPSTNSANLVDSEVPCSDNQQMMPFKRLKGSSQDLGRRYFRQQKWNGGRIPPWVRNCWRNNPPRGGAGPVSNEQRSSDNAIDCKLGREDVNYHQETPPTQNPHH
ncbi:hypothetical protein CRG98_037151 [Punica granatum]|uniref:Histone-lysine N-methyltransferase ASHH2 n=1 Tax=Punica granatum TaxID=22663 RepID=A0A2I0IER7_PUNGR|nr:hypothetical protein CRG98_037151 [Punica granatum]